MRALQFAPLYGSGRTFESRYSCIMSHCICVLAALSSTRRMLKKRDVGRFNDKIMVVVDLLFPGTVHRKPLFVTRTSYCKRMGHKSYIEAESFVYWAKSHCVSHLLAAILLLWHIAKTNKAFCLYT